MINVRILVTLIMSKEAIAYVNYSPVLDFDKYFIFTYTYVTIQSYGNIWKKKALKGVSARLLLKQYPELKKQLWGGHLWNPSYFLATVSENTEEQIRKYINSQKKGR